MFQTSQQEVPGDTRMWNLNNCIVQIILRKLKTSTLSESLLMLPYFVLYLYYIRCVTVMCWCLCRLLQAAMYLLFLCHHVTAKGSLCNCSTIWMTAAFTFLGPLLWPGGWHSVTKHQQFACFSATVCTSNHEWPGWKVIIYCVPFLLVENLAARPFN